MAIDRLHLKSKPTYSQVEVSYHLHEQDVFHVAAIL